MSNVIFCTIATSALSSANTPRTMIDTACDYFLFITLPVHTNQKNLTNGPRPMMLRMAKISKVAADFVRVVKPIIDRPHLDNHSAKCKKLYNPKDYPELNGVNTIIAEQTFQWLKRHRFRVRHMGRCHFRLYMLRIMHLHNIRKSRIISKSEI